MDFSRNKRLLGPKIKERILFIIQSIKDTTDIDEFQFMLIEGFKILQFQDIEGYVPCERKLYITHNEVYMFLLHHIRQKNNHFFRQTEYDGYDYLNGMTFEILRNTVNTCVTNLTRKQRCQEV